MSDEQEQPGERIAPATDNAILASDPEREAAVARLNQACREGRLALEEFSERVGLAYAARTRGELEQLLHDLPQSERSFASSPATGTQIERRPQPKGRTEWHISPIGGLKRRGHWRMDRQTVSITLVGGMKLDLCEAEFAAPEVTLTKVSLVGGVRLAVPPGVRVEVTNISLIGGRRDDVDERVGPDAPTVHVRAFGLIGGVRVQRTLRRERRRDRLSSR